MSSVTRNLKLGKDGCIKHEIILKSPSSFAQSVMVNASVVEDGTLIRGKALAKIEIRNSRRKNLPEFSLGTKKRKFKPGLPFRGEVVLFSDCSIYSMLPEVTKVRQLQCFCFV